MDLFEVHTDRGVLNSGHSHVSDVCGALAYRFVGRLHMRMRADHGRGTAPEVITHHLLFGCRLCMKIYNQGLAGGGTCDEVVGRPKRVVVRLHEDAPDELRYRDAFAVACRVTGVAQPR